MNKIIYILGLFVILGLASFASCSDEDDEYRPWEPTEVLGISGENVENGIISLYTQGTHQTAITFSPDDATNKNDYTFEYASSDEKIFTVNTSGLIKCTAKEGEAILTITAQNNTAISFSCVVKTTNEFFPITSIVFSDIIKEGFKMYPGNFVDLNKHITINPTNASIPKIIITSSNEELASLSDNTILTARGLGEVTITVVADDGASKVSESFTLNIVKVESTNIDRRNWTITASHAPYVENSLTGNLDLMIDNILSTQMAMIKPGGTIGTQSVPTGAEVFFVINMGQKQSFNSFYIRHRTTNSSANLRLSEASFYGSNDGSNFELILANAVMPVTVNDHTVVFAQSKEYQYLKVQHEKSGSGQSFQISEIQIGTAIK